MATPLLLSVPAESPVLEAGWPREAAEGRELLGALLRERRGNGRRQAFGLLERPGLGLGLDVAAYKVFVSGRSGVGKTALLVALAAAGGTEAGPGPHETLGIQTSSVLWPARLRGSGRALLFRFSFWDCGEAQLRRFHHLLPSCLEKADAVLLLFSFTDRASFEELPQQMARLEAQRLPPQEPPPLTMVVGTKFDQFAHADVTERDVDAFRRAWGLPVFRAKSLGAPRPKDGRAPDPWAGLSEVAPLLDGLAEGLWRRDQMAAGLLPPSVPCPTE